MRAREDGDEVGRSIVDWRKRSEAIGVPNAVSFGSFNDGELFCDE
jgi:hypothetical protein